MSTDSMSVRSFLLFQWHLPDKAKLGAEEETTTSKCQQLQRFVFLPHTYKEMNAADEKKVWWAC